MTATAHAVQPPAHAPAPPVQRKAEPVNEVADKPQRLLTSLSAVPAVQRQCATCDARDDEEETPVQPRLEVGPVDDPYEREADDIAGQVMAIRQPAIQRVMDANKEDTDAEVLPRPIAVQRKCTACDSDHTSVMPKLEVGPVDDPYEREADDIAGQVMAMRDPIRRQSDDAPEESILPRRAPILRQSEDVNDEIDDTVMPRRASVQRKCATCADEEEMPVQPRRAPASVQRMPAPLLESDPLRDLADMPRMRPDAAAAGTEHIAASATQLTSGGSPLYGPTRDFFESRMGRDLSNVRVHDNDEASALNLSIQARAFTYRNHIWLGRGESTGPSFTMAHELAHVMQQTASGPVKPNTASAQHKTTPSATRSLVQPSRPFWTPMSSKSAKGLHTAMHNAAQLALRSKNTDKKLMEEVPIPAAKSGPENVGPEHVGFADLFLSDNGNVPGLRPWNPASDKLPPTASGEATDPLPVTNLTAANTTFSGGPLIGQGFKRLASKTRSRHESYRQPRIDKNARVFNFSKAPSDMQVGEVKPAHDEDYRSYGSTHQLQNYVKGIKLTVAETNKALVAKNSANTWNHTVGLLDSGDISLPDGWNTAGSPAAATDWPIASIKIRSSRKITKLVSGKKKKSRKAIDIKPGGSRAKKSAEPAIRGRWSMAFDPENKGLIVYYLMPHPDDLEAALKTGSGATATFRKTARGLSKVLDPLMATPKLEKGKGKARRRPLTSLATISRAPAQIQRDAVDSFDRKTWEANRVGHPDLAKESKNNLAEQLEETAPEEMRERITDAGDMVDWLKQPPLPGQTTRYPAASKFNKISKDAISLNKLLFWTSDFAKPFGFLREKFGGVFVTVANKLQDLRTKLEEKFKNRNMSGGAKGTLYKTAAKVGSLVLGAIGKPIAKAVFQKVVQCAKSGFIAKMKALVDGAGFDELVEKGKRVQTLVDSYKQDLTGYVDTVIEDTLGPIETEINVLVAKGKAAAALFGTVAEIAKAARIGSCIAGLIAAPETVGIGAVVGCGAALGDWILSKFGLSPVEYFISVTLRNCSTKMKIARALEKVDLVKKIPTVAAKKIVSGTKDLLKKNLPEPFGTEAASLLCNADDISVEPPKVKKSDICPHVSPPHRFRGNDFKAPRNLRRYKEGDPGNDPDKEAQWQGWDDETPPSLGGAGIGANGVTEQKLEFEPSGDMQGVTGYPTILKSSLKAANCTNKATKVMLRLRAGGHDYEPFQIPIVIVKYPVEKDGKLYATVHFEKPWAVTEKGIRNGRPYEESWGPRYPKRNYDYPVK